MAYRAMLMQSIAQQAVMATRLVETWEYLGRLAEAPQTEGDTQWRGAWECPLFWTLNDCSILIVDFASYTGLAVNVI